LAGSRVDAAAFSSAMKASLALKWSRAFMHLFEVGWRPLILWLCCTDKDIYSVHLQHVPVQIRVSATQHTKVNLWWRKNYGLYGKGKRKSCPCPYHKGIWLHFLTSALDGGECWHHLLATLLPGKKPRTPGIRSGVGPWAYLDVLEKLPLPAGIQTHDRVVRVVFAIPTELFQLLWSVRKLN
jgi:hypothetical protein